MDFTIGILAIQGGFSEHECALLKCLKQNGGVFQDINLKVHRVTQASDVPGLDGLVIPGGESSVTSRILDDAIMDELCTWANDDKHILFGTCAGLIVLSKNIENSMAGQQRRLSKVRGYTLGYFMQCNLTHYTHKNRTSCSKSANKPSTSCVRTACPELSTSLEQAVNNL
jgi:cobyrinic acid a,c-diamide synthase